MTTLLAANVEFNESLNDSLLPRARELLSKMILPQRISSETVERYLRKALRTGAWRTLRRESRALLLAASRVGLRRVRSSTLKEVLKKIFIEIELHTFKGRAYLHGILHLLKHAAIEMLNLTELLRNKLRVLIIGIQQLNNPVVIRCSTI